MGMTHSVSLGSETKKGNEKGRPFRSQSKAWDKKDRPRVPIDHSMSRAGTPTDNAAMEAINGWIKAELFMDFHVTGEKPVYQEIDDYIQFFNEQRPAYSLGYLTPKQYKDSFALPVV